MPRLNLKKPTPLPNFSVELKEFQYYLARAFRAGHIAGMDRAIAIMTQQPKRPSTRRAAREDK